MKTYYLEITPKQAEVAVDAGMEFYLESRKSGRRNKFGSGMIGSVDGEQAVMAYCVFKGIPYEKRVCNFHGADVGKRTQIRSTRHRDGRLVLHKEDDDLSHFYVLVRQHTKFEIVGWGIGSELIKEATLEDHGYPALYVPNHILNEF